MDSKQTKAAIKAAVEFLYKSKTIRNDQDLADKLGYKKSAVSLYVNGASPVSKSFAAKFEEVFKLSLEDYKPLNDAPELKITDADIRTEEYINLLKKNLQDQDERIKSLLRINSNLKDDVQSSLEKSLANQLALTSLFESAMKSLSEVLVHGKEAQREFRVNLHKDAFQRLMVLKKKGNLIEIDNADTI